MKVDSAHVVSFGRMRDRDFRFGPGLNVVYGPNEAGKSTLRTFVTLSMFPKAPLKYPATKGSDEGSLEVTLENGDRLVFAREGKKGSGTGAEICGIDDREYVSIYSMSPDDLRDVKGIEKGDIRSRFLTIPGGADLPQVYDDLDEERTKLLPDQRRNAKCEIAVLIQKAHDLSNKVRQLQSGEYGDNRYSELSAEAERLRTEIGGAEEDAKRKDDIRKIAKSAADRERDLLNIEDLEKREKELSYAENVDEKKMAVLDSELSRTEEAFTRAKKRAEKVREELPDIDTAAYLKAADRIRRLKASEQEYDTLAGRVGTPAPAAIEKKTFPLVAAAGIAVTVAGFAITVFNTVAGAAVAVAGIVIAVIGLRSRRDRAPADSGPSEDPRLLSLEKDLDETAGPLGIPRRGFHSDVDTLSRNLELSEEYAAMRKEVSDTKEEYDDASKACDLFLSGYGGREGFEKAAKDHDELKEVRAKLKVLRESTAEVVPDAPDAEEAENEYTEANTRFRDMSARLAKTEQALKDISDNGSVEDAITAAAEADSAVYEACYRWARLMMEKIIIDKASDEAYGAHRPEVLSRADRYLSMMTGGRYRIDTDPRLQEIAVREVSDGTSKTVKEWSSGLEDQIKLSVKMAVALSLSAEKPPVILDDVLLTSDSVRKKGACDALALLAADIQVIYFTCDRETRDLLAAAGAETLDI